MRELLIIASSGRMLAQAARDAGFVPVVIDCFADTDTTALAFEFYQVESLAVNDIRSAVELLELRIECCVYGSGFEGHQESLFFLSRHFRLLGNPPETFAALHDKRDFFRRLQYLNINFPDVFFPETISNRSHAPAWECRAHRSGGASWQAFKKTGYLKKSCHGQGGFGIQKHLAFDKRFGSRTAGAVRTAFPRRSLGTSRDYYYQLYLHGQTMSALFIANGRQGRILGFNTQWTTALSSKQPFIFSGIINHAELSNRHRQILKNWVNKLTRSYGLQGLCSLDFILYGNKCHVLEINPRPPASMQLYDADILKLHLGVIDLRAIKDLRGLHYSAYQIIYAPEKTKIPDTIDWPKNCYDLPENGAIIPKDQPICSMIAKGKNPAQLRLDLQDNQQHLLLNLSETQHD